MGVGHTGGRNADSGLASAALHARIEKATANHTARMTVHPQSSQMDKGSTHAGSNRVSGLKKIPPGVAPRGLLCGFKPLKI